MRMNLTYLFLLLFFSHKTSCQVYMEHPYSMWDGSQNDEIHCTVEDTVKNLYILGNTQYVSGNQIFPGNLLFLNKSDFSINWFETNNYNLGAAEVNDIILHRESYVVSAVPDDYTEIVTRMFVIGKVHNDPRCRAIVSREQNTNSLNFSIFILNVKKLQIP